MAAYNHNILSKLIGEKVSVSDNQGNEVSLTISIVTENKMGDNQWEAFSVIYNGDESFRIAPGVYTFKHPGFEKKQLFLSPNSETEYETVVTREQKTQAEETCF